MKHIPQGLVNINSLQNSNENDKRILQHNLSDPNMFDNKKMPIIYYENKNAAQNINYYNIDKIEVVREKQKSPRLNKKSNETNEEIKQSIEKLKILYKEIEEFDWIDESLQKEIDNINFILSSNASDEFDLQYTKYLTSDRRKTKAISIKSKTKAKIVNNKTLYK